MSSREASGLKSATDEVGVEQARKLLAARLLPGTIRLCSGRSTTG